MSADDTRSGTRSLLRALIETKLRMLRDPSVIGIASVFALKCSFIGLNFALVMLAARVLDTEHFGVYSIFFSATGLFCIVATFGQQVLIMRSWNEYVASGQTGLLKGSLIYSLLTCLAGGAVIGLAFYAWAATTYTAMLAAAATIFLIVQALSLTTAHLVRTAIGVGSGDGYGNILVVIPPIIYLLMILIWGGTASISAIFFLFTAGTGTALLIHLYLMRRRIAERVPTFWTSATLYDLGNWFSRSYKLWISINLEAANQYLDVLIIGYLTGPAIAGGYFVTTRLANAFATASDTMHLFSTRHIPDYYYRGEMKQLNRLLNSVALITLACIVCGMVIILGGGKFFLMVFNDAYVPYYPALAVLSCGTAAAAAAGPSGSILMLTGHEGSYLRIMASSVFIRAVGFFVLIPPLGIMGAVCATTVSFIFMAGMLRHSAKTLTGLDGSVWRLVHARREIASASPAE